MNQNSNAQQAFIAFTQCETKLIDDAVSCAVAYKTDPGGFGYQPLVICKTQAEWDEWSARVEEWHHLADELSTSAPNHYPKKSKIFNPAPLMFRGVSACRLIETPATSSQRMTKAQILKMLNIKLRIASRSKVAQDIEFLERIKRDIEFFERSSDQIYRLRRDGYVCQRAILTIGDDISPKNMNHRGMFLYSGHDDKPVEFKDGHDRSYTRSPTVYDLLSPIDTVLNTVGAVYSQRAVDEMNAKMKAARDWDKGRSRRLRASDLSGLKHPEITED